MSRMTSAVWALIGLTGVLLATGGKALGQVPAIISNGSLGPLDSSDGYYTLYFNTDAMTLDVYTPAGGYTTGAWCPPGTYTGPGDPDGCARLVSQPGGLGIVVFDFTTVYIGTTVYVVGARPAAIAATGALLVAGTINVQNGCAGATLVTPDGAGLPGSGPGGGGGGAGPGYYVAVDCGNGETCYEVLTGGGGGGGGGAAGGAEGGDGNILVEIGTGTVHQMSGGTAGAASLDGGGPLQGGSGGGSGGDRMVWGGPAHYGGAAGGRGGGALILATPGNLDVSGTISAVGAAGQPSSDGGGGGGGFLAFQVGGTLTNQVTGHLSAAGGAGGVGPGGQVATSYGGAGGGGIISLRVGTLVNLGTMDVSGATQGAVVVRLQVTGGGTGSGTVTSQVGLDPAISCSVTHGVASGTCTQWYPLGTSVTLTPAPATGSSFTGWSGPCGGTAPCTVEMSETRDLTGTFDLIPYPLTVAGSGTGSGTITSQVGLTPAIACTITNGVASGACGQMYLYGTSVTLTAAGVDSAFVGWSSGACTGTGPCAVTVTQALTATASFVVRPTVTGIMPPTGVTNGGTLVTIAGTGFVNGATTVTIGGLAATGISVTSPTSLRAVTPAGLAGPAVVSVTTAGGTGTLAGAFTYVLLPPGPRRDYDGDGRADFVIFRPSTGTWYGIDSSTDYTTWWSRKWGTDGDVPVAGDPDGDGKADLIVFRPSTGTWYGLDSSSGYTTSWSYRWGTNGDAPVAADFDGDGSADLAVFRPSTGTWYVLESSTGFTTWWTAMWGTSGDVPVPGDYDGDGAADLVVYRPASGTWFGLGSSTGWTTAWSARWGTAGDEPVPADYDGDRKLDLAVFRPSTGTWYARDSSTNHTTWWLRQWGANGDAPAAADYEADGRADAVIWRPSTGTWHGVDSSTLFTTWWSVRWGAAGDVPVRR